MKKKKKLKKCATKGCRKHGIPFSYNRIGEIMDPAKNPTAAQTKKIKAKWKKDAKKRDVEAKNRALKAIGIEAEKALIQDCFAVVEKIWHLKPNDRKKVLKLLGYSLPTDKNKA